MLTVTGSPVGPFVDGVYATLSQDAALSALLTGGVATVLPKRVRTAFPYAVLSEHGLGGSDTAMQLEGGQVYVVIHVWSSLNDPDETRRIQSRIRQLLLRQSITIAGFTLIKGSLECEDEKVFQQPDPDIPERELTHGIQRWVAFVEESQ